MNLKKKLDTPIKGFHLKEIFFEINLTYETKYGNIIM